MRSSGQTRADLMALRALISNGVSTVTGKIDALESSLSPVATSGDYSDLTGTPDLSVYALSADLASVATSGSYADLTGTPDLSVYAESADLAAVATSGAYSDLDGTPALAGVATSGAYSDLTGKPTLGALASQNSVTHLQVSDWSSATSRFLTEHQSLAAYAKKADLGDLASLDTIPHSKISDWASATSSFLTSHQDISGLLAKSGGTMSGAISISGAFSSGFVKQTVTDSYTMLSGGTTTNNGAVLILSGGTRPTYAGMFRLSARTSSGNKKDLDGWSDGTLTWDNNAILHEGLAPTAVELTFPEVEAISANSIRCERYGKVVMLYIGVTLTAALSSATTVATGLPAPASDIYQVVNTWTSSYRRPIRARITTAGALTFQYGYATSYNHVITYLAA